MLAPAETPAPIVARLNEELHKALAAPDVRASPMSNGLEITPGTPADFGRKTHADLERWGKLIRSANITL